ncbi:cyclic AMP-responsive element-binding protein 3-like protein 4 isoform 2-T2 [Lycodopsis pacificus]
MDPESGDGGVTADSWQLDASFSGSNLVFSGSENPLQVWGVVDQTMNDSESEDVLQAVDPNEVFPSGPPAGSWSESDNGVSEGPLRTPTIYQLVYDISSLKTEPGQENVVSIELDGWSSQVLFSDSCIVNQLPVVSAARLQDPPSPDRDLLFSDLQLTEEEQKLLTQEGVSLPNNLPLTKAEERILKRVRRKIRNKQSAQDSRRRRKEYIDGLESRAVSCSTQNKELQRTVEQLEKHNMSLLTQMGRLQSLIKQTLVLVSLGLIILPSFSPFSRNSSPDDDYRPSGVISRNILTDPSVSQQTADDADVPAVRSDSSSPPFELGQSGPPEAVAILQEPIEPPESTGSDGSRSGNDSALVSGPAEPLVLGLRSAGGKGSDVTKPAHADEM